MLHACISLKTFINKVSGVTSLKICMTWFRLSTEKLETSLFLKDDHLITHSSRVGKALLDERMENVLLWENVYINTLVYKNILYGEILYQILYNLHNIRTLSLCTASMQQLQHHFLFKPRWLRIQACDAWLKCSEGVFHSRQKWGMWFLSINSQWQDVRNLMK